MSLAQEEPMSETSYSVLNTIATQEKAELGIHADMLAALMRWRGTQRAGGLRRTGGASRGVGWGKA